MHGSCVCQAGDKSSSLRAVHNVGVLSIISGMDSRADKRAVSVATETGDRHHQLSVALPSVQRDCFGRGRSICDCHWSWSACYVGANRALK